MVQLTIFLHSVARRGKSKLRIKFFFVLITILEKSGFIIRQTCFSRPIKYYKETISTVKSTKIQWMSKNRTSEIRTCSKTRHNLGKMMIEYGFDIPILKQIPNIID